MWTSMPRCGRLAHPLPPCPRTVSTTEQSNKLSNEEEWFVLALVEYAGNVAMAYKVAFGPDASMPTARGRELMTDPRILDRLVQLHAAKHETALLSISSHLIELAAIRDLSKTLNAPKTALDAERSRGEVMGFYNKMVSAEDPTTARVEAVRATLRAAMSIVET